MAGLANILRRFIIRLLDGATREQRRDVVIDTKLGQPRDLDDPFSDPHAQARVAKLIAEKGARRFRRT